MTLHVLHVASEMYPLLKTGGLADVTGALPPALSQLGVDTRVLLPGFPAVLAGLVDRRPVLALGPRFGLDGVALHYGVLPTTGVGVYAIEAPAFYDRPGNPYMDDAQHPYTDNCERFALLGWVAARLAEGVDRDWRPRIVHAHDWHAGLACAYLKAAERRHGKLAGTVMTVHNLAYQGVFPASSFARLGLPPDFFQVEGVEFYGQLSFLKAGLYYADRLTTVSPTYAREIRTPEQGGGLQGLLATRASDLTGILNGVDYTVWSPAHDTALATRYRKSRLTGKADCKRALQRHFGLAPLNDVPLFGMVSRLTEQKGLDLLLAGLPDLVRRGGQLVVLGTGDPALEAGLRRAAQAAPENVAIHIGFDEILAHQIIGGSDVVLVPSRFEPCGLTQLYGLAYGSLPLVHKVGGLADSVVDASLENLDDALATGMVFDRFDLDGFSAAVRRAFALYGRRTDWKQTQRRAMEQDFSWDASAQHYLALYQQVATAG